MLITGATGFIGSRLATLALARGYLVKTLTQSDWATSPAVPVECRYFGSLPEQIPHEALQGIDIVVHCAASVDAAERSAHTVNVEGTIRLAQLSRQASVQTFIFLSSQSARPDALSPYGRTKYAAEQALQNVDGLNIIILRPGLVTGSGSRGLFHRLSKLVETFPVIPLLGGGKAIVQPIHVDDLCAAIFRCVEAASELHGTILKLGHPQGLSMREFLQAIALARLGRRKITLPIPLWPVEVTTGIAEALHFPLPINSNNLKGLKIVERMETAADMDRLRLSLRPLDEMVRDGTDSADQPLSVKQRAVRVLLIGAGRIGLVHAVTLLRLKGVTLSGVVDPKAAQTNLLRGMGLPAHMFQELEEALVQTRPDAAVIATPAATHLPLARTCLSHGLAVMVEKPLAIRQEQLVDYERLAQEFSNCPVQVGYVMPRNPHVASYLERLCAGQYGKVRGFIGVTLLSLIQESTTSRWEVKKSISGGGVFINSGGHVLSMIRAAFGDPQAIEAESFKLYSTEVEDSMVLNLIYPKFAGQHYCSWSVSGYPRQENLLTIWTERGRLILTGSIGAFIHNHGEVELSHQLDFDVGFNLAPDYAGAGFTTELNDLKEAVRTRQPAPMNLKEAIELERLLFKAYDVSRDVRTFSDTPLTNEPLPSVKLRLSDDVPASKQVATAIRRVLDLRDLSAARVHAYMDDVANKSEWDQFLLTSAQLNGVLAHWRNSDRLRVTVPDFLSQSRLLSTGQYGEVLKQIGLGGITMAVRAATPLLMSERAPTFWVAAIGLLGAGLQAVPTRFQGTLLLHGYLTDFALSLRRLDMLEKMLKTCRKIRPYARVGFHTNLAAEALNALQLLDTPVDEVSILTSPHALDMATMLSRMRQVGARSTINLTAEVGLAPDIVHRLAADSPEHWAFGADAVLIGIGADASLAKQRQAELEQEWTRVFPGLSLPEGVLQ